MTPTPPAAEVVEVMALCPFCGGHAEIRETRLSPRMDGKVPALVSVEVRHWCADMPGMVASHINFRGRDHASAIAAWNRRTVPSGWRLVPPSLAAEVDVVLKGEGVVVPVEPTGPMLNEGVHYLPCTPGGVHPGSADGVYRAMLAASPYATPPSAADAEGV